MPSIKKRGNTYRIMVSLGYGLDGKQIRKTTTYRPPADVTPGKAEKLATAFAYEFEKRCQGMANLDENLRFKDLYDWYYEQIAPHKLKENTIYNNRRILELYVLPDIGHLKLKDINTARIDALFNKLHQCGARTERYLLTDETLLANGTRRPLFRKSGVTMETMHRMAEGTPVTKDTALKICEAAGVRLGDCFQKVLEDRGLAEGTVKRVRTALSPIFSTAVKKELLLKNPVTNATNPKDTEGKEHPFLDAAQCREVLRLADDFTNPQLTRIVRTLLYTGMRSGELCALHWTEVDLENAKLEVKYNLYRVGGEYKLSSPKTKSSARLIALPPQVVDILREQKAWQEKQKIMAGDQWVEIGAVFTGLQGGYISKNYINFEFKKFLKRNGLPDVHIHDLRHANASLLINMGIPVKIISEHLGHCDTRTTENIYAHVFAETMAQASDAISKALSAMEE